MRKATPATATPQHTTSLAFSPSAFVILPSSFPNQEKSTLIRPAFQTDSGMSFKQPLLPGIAHPRCFFLRQAGSDGYHAPHDADHTRSFQPSVIGFQFWPSRWRGPRKEMGVGSLPLLRIAWFSANLTKALASLAPRRLVVGR
jgi:hypothetical protein